MGSITTADEFKKYVADIEATAVYRKPLGFGVCRVEKGQIQTDKILSCSFPVVNWGKNFGSAAVFQKAAGVTDARYTDSEIVLPVTDDFLSSCLEIFAPFLAEAQGDNHRNVQLVDQLKNLTREGKTALSDYRIVFVYEDAHPQSVPAIYLKLLALSTGAAALRSLNLTGIFGKLENVAWVDGKPLELGYLRQKEIEMKLTGTYPEIASIDKFPRYLQHVIPADNTRILDASRVRLGAHIAAGTTIMPGASYVNFNAGTLGATMLEGRVSSSVVVGKDTDIGGGASILGVLSGGNSTPISVGEKCLLGANSVTGISLGDGCIVDAGVSVLAGTRLFMDEQARDQLRAINPKASLSDTDTTYHNDLKLFEIKASKLSGFQGLHFRVDSRTGRAIVKRSTKEIQLNEALHAPTKTA